MNNLTPPEVNAAIEVQRTQPLATTAVDQLERLLARGNSPDEIGKILDVFERMQKMEAEKAFNVAFAQFQQDCPPINKGTPVSYVTGSGNRMEYNYASLQQVDEIALPHLNRNGLSRRFGDMTVKEGMLTVSCILSHVQGHCISAIGTYPVESTTKVSAQQKFGMAETYAKRRAFANVAGLRLSDPDTDGNEPNTEPGELITDSQKKALMTLIADTQSDEAKFCKYMGVDDVAYIQAIHYAKAENALRKKLK